MADCYLTNQSQKLTYVIESSIFSGGSLGGDYLNTLNFILSTGYIVILSTNDGYFYYSSHSAPDTQGVQKWYFTGITSSYSGYVLSFNEFSEAWDLSSINIQSVDSSLSATSTNPVQNKVINTALAGKLSTTGGTLTGNLTGKYIVGTWLQTTDVTEANSTLKVAVIDNSGWIYYRTLANFKSDIGVPTKVSDLTNDSGYITASSLPTIDTAISTTSTNAVTNKAIAAKFTEYDPLIANAESLTYDIVRERVIAGKPLSVTIHDATYGSLTFTNFALSENFQAVCSNMIAKYVHPGSYITSYILAELVFTPNGSGKVYTTSLAQISDIPTKTSQLTNDSSYAKETWVTQQIQAAIDATWEASY